MAFLCLCLTFDLKTVLFISVAYLVHMFVYKPHLSKGWPNASKYFLYSPMTDYVLHYHDATVVRNGPIPDPTGKHTFLFVFVCVCVFLFV